MDLFDYRTTCIFNIHGDSCNRRKGHMDGKGFEFGFGAVRTIQEIHKGICQGSSVCIMSSESRLPTSQFT